MHISVKLSLHPDTIFSFSNSHNSHLISSPCLISENKVHIQTNAGYPDMAFCLRLLPVVEADSLEPIGVGLWQVVGGENARVEHLFGQHVAQQWNVVRHSSVIIR